MFKFLIHLNMLVKLFHQVHVFSNIEMLLPCFRRSFSIKLCHITKFINNALVCLRIFHIVIPRILLYSNSLVFEELSKLRYFILLSL